MIKSSLSIFLLHVFKLGGLQTARILQRYRIVKKRFALYHSFVTSIFCSVRDFEDFLLISSSFYCEKNSSCNKRKDEKQSWQVEGLRFEEVVEIFDFSIGALGRSPRKSPMSRLLGKHECLKKCNQ